jgi:hypothetical protein
LACSERSDDLRRQSSGIDHRLVRIRPNNAEADIALPAMAVGAEWHY